MTTSRTVRLALGALAAVLLLSGCTLDGTASAPSDPYVPPTPKTVALCNVVDRAPGSSPGSTMRTLEWALPWAIKVVAPNTLQYMVLAIDSSGVSDQYPQLLAGSTAPLQVPQLAPKLAAPNNPTPFQAMVYNQQVAVWNAKASAALQAAEAAQQTANEATAQQVATQLQEIDLLPAPSGARMDTAETTAATSAFFALSEPQATTKEILLFSPLTNVPVPPTVAGQFAGANVVIWGPSQKDMTAYTQNVDAWARFFTHSGAVSVTVVPAENRTGELLTKELRQGLQ